MNKTAGLIFFLFAAPLTAETTTYRDLFAGDDTGRLIVDRDANEVAIDFDYRQNGRGAAILEEMTLDERDYAVGWTISGTTTFAQALHLGTRDFASAGSNRIVYQTDLITRSQFRSGERLPGQVDDKVDFLSADVEHRCVSQ
jgi:hypothetical protein